VRLDGFSVSIDGLGPRCEIDPRFQEQSNTAANPSGELFPCLSVGADAGGGLAEAYRRELVCERRYLKVEWLEEAGLVAAEV